MRADGVSLAATDHSQPELHVSDGSGVGASVADRRRLLSEIRLTADDVEHSDQFERNQDRDFPMRSTLSGLLGAQATAIESLWTPRPTWRVLLGCSMAGLQARNCAKSTWRLWPHKVDPGMSDGGSVRDDGAGAARSGNGGGDARRLSQAAVL